jgi:hypothetical protein
VGRHRHHPRDDQFTSVYVPDFHTYGGLRLQSSPTESLVVKFSGDAGIVSTGRPLDIEDRIGGILAGRRIAGFPVVLTSVNDCSVGAGWKTDTLNSGACSTTNVVAAGSPYADVIVVIGRVRFDAAASRRSPRDDPESHLSPRASAMVRRGSTNTRWRLHWQPAFGRARSFGRWRHGTSVQYVTAAAGLVTQGGVADGYKGLDFALAIDQYSHDRNVDIIIEREPIGLAPPGNNAIPSQAQSLGTLAPNEKSGDDNLRLGFVVKGTLNTPSDLDVFSFRATAGTEIWLDVDRTTHALDAVVELIDANGQILAQSLNSARETDGVDPLNVYSHPTLIPANHVNILQKSAFFATHVDGGAPKDFWTTNPRDAGMRVVLPGGVGSVNTYHVRVRSSNIDQLAPGANLADMQDPAKLRHGLTAGNYELQIRLREKDELAGTTIRHADIRYAQTGIYVSGMPIHSPLTGEAFETEGDSGSSHGPNSTIQGAQWLGNLANTDRAAISVGGRIHSTPNFEDVDWYEFVIAWDSVQSGSGVQMPVIFDVDYADGLGRPDLNLAIYRETHDISGNPHWTLIYAGQDSNIADDQPGPLLGNDMSDLSRGSAGNRDPYIGPINLAVGRYYMAVTTNRRIAAPLLQYQTANPPDPAVRVEPIPTIDRVANDESVEISSTAATPFHLGDIMLFVSSRQTDNRSQLHAVDPFTGNTENTIGWFTGTRDIATRPDGNIYGYQVNDTGDDSDANNQVYLRIDPGAANWDNLASNAGGHGLQTREQGAGMPLSHVVSGGARVGDGMEINAMAFGAAAGSTDTLRLVGVGQRANNQPNQPNRPGVTHYDNILYLLDPSTGAATSNPAPNRDNTNLGQTGNADHRSAAFSTRHCCRAVS